MIFLVDTCFLMHCIELIEENILDFDLVQSQFNFGITEEIKKEIHHYNIDEKIDISQFYIAPVPINEFDEFQIRHPTIMQLDLADQTIIFSAYRDLNFILSDDGGLVMEAKSMNLNAAFLHGFLFRIFLEEVISKNVLNKCIRYWEMNSSYSQKLLKKLKNNIQKS